MVQSTQFVCFVLANAKIGTYRIEHLSGAFFTLDTDNESDRDVPKTTIKRGDIDTVPTGSLWDLTRHISENDVSYTFVHRNTGRTLGLGKDGELTANKNSRLDVSQWSLASGIAFVSDPPINTVSSDVSLYSLSPHQVQKVTSFVVANFGTTSFASIKPIDVPNSQQWRLSRVDVGVVETIAAPLFLANQPVSSQIPYAIMHILHGRLLSPPVGSIDSSTRQLLHSTYKREASMLWIFQPATPSTYIITTANKTSAIIVENGKIETGPVVEGSLFRLVQNDANSYMIQLDDSLANISMDSSGIMTMQNASDRNSLWRIMSLDSLVSSSSLGQAPSPKSNSNELQLPDGLYQVFHKQSGKKLWASMGTSDFGDCSLSDLTPPGISSTISSIWYLSRPLGYDSYLVRSYISPHRYLDAGDITTCPSWNGEISYLMPRNAFEKSQYWSFRRIAPTGGWMIVSQHRKVALGMNTSPTEANKTTLPSVLLQTLRSTPGQVEDQIWDFKQVRPWFSSGNYHIQLSTSKSIRFLGYQPSPSGIWQIIEMTVNDFPRRSWLITNQSDGTFTLQAGGVAKFLTADPVTVAEVILPTKVEHPVEHPESTLLLTNTCNGTYSRWFFHPNASEEPTFVMENCATGFILNLVATSPEIPPKLTLTQSADRELPGLVKELPKIFFDSVNSDGRSFDDLTSDKVEDGAYTLTLKGISSVLMFPKNVNLTTRIVEDLAVLPTNQPLVILPGGVDPGFSPAVNITSTQDGYYMIWQSNASTDQRLLVHETVVHPGPRGGSVVDVVGRTYVDGTDSVRWKFLKDEELGCYRIINKESGRLLTFAADQGLSCQLDNLAGIGQLWQLGNRGQLESAAIPIRREVNMPNGKSSPFDRLKLPCRCNDFFE
jgi:hypothetical protein